MNKLMDKETKEWTNKPAIKPMHAGAKKIQTNERMKNLYEQANKCMVKKNQLIIRRNDQMNELIYVWANKPKDKQTSEKTNAQTKKNSCIQEQIKVQANRGMNKWTNEKTNKWKKKARKYCIGQKFS